MTPVLDPFMAGVKAVPVVDLTWREVRLACLAAIDRRLMHLSKQTRDHHGRPTRDRGWEIDIQGALGEFVIAKLLDRYWSGGNPKEQCDGDVGGRQVRATTLDHGGLIVYEDDPDDATFILVVGVPPQFRVPGWMNGADAKQPQWWRPDFHDPAYLVPQSALQSVAGLT